MQEFTSHKPGTFCWVDLSTKDVEAAKQYYCDLLGLSTYSIVLDGGFTYTYFMLNGKPVAALGEMMREQIEMGIPPFWMTYVCSSNAVETMEKVKSLGGTVAMEATQVGDYGKFGIFQDSEGGFFGVWEPMNHIGTSYKYVPGSLCWTEYTSHNRDKSIKFYSELFGWGHQTKSMGPMDYTTFIQGEEMVAGLYQATPEMSEIPPNWLPYFEVTDVDNVISKAVKYGSNILMPKSNAEGVGDFAIIQDPQGAVFGIIKTTM